MTFLWRHQMGTNTTHNDAKSDATQHAPTQPKTHQPPFDSNHILKTAIKHHSEGLQVQYLKFYAF